MPYSFCVHYSPRHSLCFKWESLGKPPWFTSHQSGQCHLPFPHQDNVPSLSASSIISLKPPENTSLSWEWLRQQGDVSSLVLSSPDSEGFPT